MKITVEGKPPIIIGARVTIGQALLSILNGSVWFWNFTHPEQQIPGEIAGILAQPLIFFIQVWYVNRFGVTS